MPVPAGRLRSCARPARSLILAAGLAFIFGLAACGPGPETTFPPPDQRLKLLAIPDEYKGMKNPLPATRTNQQAGQKLYQEHCALCHGERGNGDTPLGRALYPRASDLASVAPQAYSDGELFWIIAQGIRYSGMPSGHGEYSEEQMWQMVLYVRALGLRLRTVPE